MTKILKNEKNIIRRWQNLIPRLRKLALYFCISITVGLVMDSNTVTTGHGIEANNKKPYHIYLVCRVRFRVYLYHYKKVIILKNDVF